MEALVRHNRGKCDQAQVSFMCSFQKRRGSNNCYVKCQLLVEKSASIDQNEKPVSFLNWQKGNNFMPYTWMPECMLPYCVCITLRAIMKSSVVLWMTNKSILPSLRRIYQCVGLSPPVFSIEWNRCLTQNSDYRYQFVSGAIITHLLQININLYARELQIYWLIHLTNLCSRDCGTSFRWDTYLRMISNRSMRSYRESKQATV